MKKVLVLLVAALFLSGCGFTYSEGTRAGVVQKLSLKGFVCKTWEGELLVGAQNVMNPKVFPFSVSNDKPEVLAQLQEAIKSGRNVELEYAQKLFQPPCSPSSPYLVNNVK